MLSYVRQAAPAIGLFLLSPLVAEFLLGNIAIDALWTLGVIAPLYGGGAVVVREVARRNGRGWPTILLLALAYAVIEEGLVTQSLFNYSYFGFNLLNPAYLPSLGIGVWWTIYVLTIHVIWSIAVPIALVESLVPDRATQPWLGKLGLSFAGSLFTLGAVVNWFTTYHQEKFVASIPQLLGTVAVVVALVVGAFALRRHSLREAARPAPSWLQVGITTFAATSLFTLGLYAPSWHVIVGWLLIFFGSAFLLLRWSRCKGWGISHQLAAAAGALFTYAWQGFPHVPIIGSQGTVDLVGNAIFALGAIALVAAAGVILYRREVPPPAEVRLSTELP